MTDSDSTRKPDSADSPSSADSGVTTSMVREIKIMGWDGIGVYFDAGMGRNSRQGPETEAET